MNMSTQSRPTNSFKLQNNLKYSFLVKIPLSSETFAFTADHVNKRIKQGFSVHRYILYYIQYILYVLYYYIMETKKVIWQNYSQEKYIIKNAVKTMRHPNVRSDHL